LLTFGAIEGTCRLFGQVAESVKMCVVSGNLVVDCNRWLSKHGAVQGIGRMGTRLRVAALDQ